MTEEPVVIGNVPHLRDVTTMIELLGRLGAEATVHDGMHLEVNAAHVNNYDAPYELVQARCVPRFWCLVRCWDPVWSCGRVIAGRLRDRCASR